VSGDIDLAAIVAEDAKTSGAVPAQEAPAPVEDTAEATTAPGDEPAEEQPSEAEGEAPQPRKPGGGFQKRISELTREKHEAKREAEQLREMLSKALGQTQQPAPAAEQSDEPRPEQYARYEDYVRAVARYDAARETKAFLSSVRKQASVEDQEKARIEAVKAFEVEAKAQGKAIQGFDDALDMVRSDDFPMTPAVADYLLNADHKAALVKYLADNEDEAFRLSRLGAVAVGRELAKVEMRFASKPRPKTSSAPPPPATVSGGAAAPQSIERMGHNDVLKWVRELDQRR
jgi:hypothetical protein